MNSFRKLKGILLIIVVFNTTLDIKSKELDKGKNPLFEFNQKMERLEYLLRENKRNQTCNVLKENIGIIKDNSKTLIKSEPYYHWTEISQFLNEKYKNLCK